MSHGRDLTVIALTRSRPLRSDGSLEDDRKLVLCWPPVWPLSTVRPRDSVCSRPATLGPGRRGADPAEPLSRAASDSPAEPQAVEVQAVRRARWLRAEPNVLRLRPPSSASVTVVTHASCVAHGPGPTVVPGPGRVELSLSVGGTGVIRSWLSSLRHNSISTD